MFAGRSCPQGAGASPGLLTPLGHPTYRRLFLAQVVALIGTGLTTVALALLAFDLSGGDAGAVLGIAFAVKMMAYVVVPPLAGAVTERLPRRGLLVGLDLGRAAAVGLMPLATEPWHAYLLILLVSVCSAGFTPVFQATIADILPEQREYTRALSLSRLAYDLENLASPALAAAIITVVGYQALFACNAAAFLVSALLVGSLALPVGSARPPGGGSVAKISRGIRRYLATPRLRGLLALTLASASASAMVIVNTVVYVRDRFELADAQVAVALGAVGAGSMVTALVLPRLLDGRDDRSLMLGGGGALALGLLVVSLAPGYLALLLVWLGLGAGLSLTQTPAGRLLQRSSTTADRPSIFAAQFSLSHACWLVTYPLAGLLATYLGLDLAALLLAGVAAGSTAVAAVLWRRPAEVRIVEGSRLRD
jgi:MFS family permease